MNNLSPYHNQLKAFTLEMDNLFTNIATKVDRVERMSLGYSNDDPFICHIEQNLARIKMKVKQMNTSIVDIQATASVLNKIIKDDVFINNECNHKTTDQMSLEVIESIQPAKNSPVKSAKKPPLLSKSKGKNIDSYKQKSQFNILDYMKSTQDIINKNQLINIAEMTAALTNTHDDTCNLNNSMKKKIDINMTMKSNTDSMRQINRKRNIKEELIPSKKYTDNRSKINQLQKANHLKNKIGKNIPTNRRAIKRKRIRKNILQKVNLSNQNSNNLDITQKCKSQHGNTSDIKNVKSGVEWVRARALRKARHDKLEQELCEWIEKQFIISKMRISRSDILNKALNLGKSLNFLASMGWYLDFIRRNMHLAEKVTGLDYGINEE